MGSNTGFSYPEKERKREDKMVDRKKLDETLLEKAKGGKIPCAACFKIAEDFGISKKEMGQVLNEIKVKISQCQLGCFE
jgi:hypothetical protein